MPPSIYHPTEWKLDPVAVRRRAKGLPGVQALPPQASPNPKDNSDHIVSFLAGLPQSSSDSSSSTATAADTVARLNVFVDTGTISTCRIWQGMPREVFRRNVTSLDVVERLLRHPPLLTQIDENLVGTTDSSTSIFVASNQNNKQSQQSAGPKKSLKEELELCEVGLCILNGEKEKLEHHLLSLEDTQQERSKHINTKDPQQKNDHSNDNTKNIDDGNKDDEEGMEFQFSLPVSAMKHVEQCLQDISRMNKLVRGVATNGKGTIFLYGNGGVAYTPNIPKHLYQKLKLLRNSPISARPSYVSLGTRDRYFVAFKGNHAVDWKGPKALDKILKGLGTAHPDGAPRSVAFGASYDTFFVVFADGSWKCHGKSIPQALTDKLEERRQASTAALTANTLKTRNGNDLVCVNLGPNGEWFLRVENGRMWWGGISEDLDAVTQDILQGGNFLHFIDFGEDGSYFLSHDS